MEVMTGKFTDYICRLCGHMHGVGEKTDLPGDCTRWPECRCLKYRSPKKRCPVCCGSGEVTA